MIPSRYIFTTLLAATTTLVRADRPIYGIEDADSYDNGTFGNTPEERFHTVDVPAYRLLRRAWDEEKCASDDKIFLGIRGRRLWHTGPAIYDNDGHQVWQGESVSPPYNFRMQWYKGEQYLTWWSGEDEGGFGSGYYYMYDNHYELYRRISAHGNHSADLHEFLITPQGTALLTVYDRKHADLSRYGVKTEPESYIADSMFQEIDLETNELLFEWRASEHFSFDDCFNPHPNSTRHAPAKAMPPPQRTSFDDDDEHTDPKVPMRKHRAWDWFHINSVSRDHLGNYLISSRYSHSLSYISRIDGSVLWQLGGKRNNFTDISPLPYSGYATSLAWQHHVQWVVDEPNVLVVFDNQAVNWDKTHSARILKIRLETTAMTAEVIAAAEHPQGYIVPSQGSVQSLQSGNMFVGYGFAAAMTEYSPDGKDVLCDWQYGALHAKLDGAYSAGGIQSYRAFKDAWTGWPNDLPKVKVGEVDPLFYSNRLRRPGLTRPSRPAFEGSGFGRLAASRRPSSSSSSSIRSNVSTVVERREETQHGEDDSAQETNELVIKETMMWISWNGATEVKTWQLERRLVNNDTMSSETLVLDEIRPNASSWIWVDSTPKTGFESGITIPIWPALLTESIDSTNAAWQVLQNHTEYRLRALDAHGRMLAVWHVDHENTVSTMLYTTAPEETPSRWAGIRPQVRRSSTASWALALLVCLLLVYAWRKPISRLYRNRGREAQRKEKLDDESRYEAAALISREGKADWNASDEDEDIRRPR